jgi:putative NADH-flavin reductase
MKLALIGATGFVGSALLPELLQRGHQVTALLRDPSRLPAQAGLTVRQADVYDGAQVAAAVQGHDAVASAFNPGWQHPQLYQRFLDGSRAIVQGVRQAGVARLLVVGGAGSLEVAPGVQLVDTPGFATAVPPEVLPGARAARDLLTELRAEAVLDWVMLSPPALLAPGERSGRYRVGGDQLLMAGEQPAGISVADLAVALADELEAPHHRRTRFTVAAG